MQQDRPVLPDPQVRKVFKALQVLQAQQVPQDLPDRRVFKVFKALQVQQVLRVSQVLTARQDPQVPPVRRA